jgi:hypothetical protein
MRTRIENVFHITPRTFWDVLFFDDEYNSRLYRELGFVSSNVTSMQTLPDGRIQRALRAEPPLNIPELLKKRIAGRLFYEEQGTFDGKAQRWEFTSTSNVAPESTRIGGSITSKPHPEGMLHIVELDLHVSALGLGGMIEKLIEKNTRDSYKVTTRFTNAFAAEKGLLAARSVNAPLL